MPLESGTFPSLILASASPRRRELLEGWGYDFEVAAADVEELHDSGASPERLTGMNALRKAKAVAAEHPEALVLGADTLVYLGAEPFGKPADLEDAARMLRRLSGQTHQVCTGVALVCLSARVETVVHEVSRVTFRSLSEDMIRDYLNRVDPLDKAGGYAVQEEGDRIVACVEGSWSNVVGLPMETVERTLDSLGIRRRPGFSHATAANFDG
jgi:septum formation protein